MKTTKTVWSIFRDLVNSKSIGAEITRQEILNHIEKELVEIGKTVRDYKLVTVDNFSSSTLDTARNMSEKVGYLAKTNTLGRYIIVEHFATDYKSVSLEKTMIMAIDVNISRINNFEYSFKLSSKNGIRHVAKALTFRNTDPFAYSSKIEKFDKKKFTFKIGMLPSLEKYIRVHNLSYQISDYDFALPEGVEIDNRMSGKYIHQRKAVEAFYRRRFGIIVVPTRGGKTFIASEILRIFLNTDDGNFMFLTDNTTLFNQAVNDIKEYFQPYGGIEVGEIKAGKIDTGKRVTVGMIQTIQSTFSARCKDKVKKRELDKYFKTLKFLCVDEIHDNCSDAKLKTYKKANKLEYQLCLSATPYRTGTLVQNLKLKEWSGDVLYTITEKRLRERKVLSDYRVFMLLIDHNDIEYDIEVEDYNGYRKELIFESKLRNKLLMQVIGIRRELNLKTLVLFQSVEHGRSVERLSGIPFISGETESEEEER